MKKIIVAFFFLAFLSNVSNAFPITSKNDADKKSCKYSFVRVTSTPDTLSYLQSILANKAYYIGKPFSTLLSDLQIQIKYFCPIADIPYDKQKETKTLFAFYFPQSADEIYLTYPCLRIFWEPHLNATTAHYLYSKYNGGGWTQEVIDYYASAIVKNIEISE